MSYFVPFVFFLSLFVVGCSTSQNEVYDVNRFAKLLKSKILQQDMKALVALPCYPNACLDKDNVPKIFGKESELFQFFNRTPNVRYHVIKADESCLANCVFHIVYFDPAQVTFKDGFMPAEQRHNLGGTAYFETRVKQQNGQWGFYFTPFYWEAHLPWVEDYG